MTQKNRFLVPRLQTSPPTISGFFCNFAEVSGERVGSRYMG